MFKLFVTIAALLISVSAIAEDQYIAVCKPSKTPNVLGLKNLSLEMSNEWPDAVMTVESEDGTIFTADMNYEGYQWDYNFTHLRYEQGEYSVHLFQNPADKLIAEVTRLKDGMSTIMTCSLQFK